MKTRRETILGALQDTLSNFLYYDRKEDDNLCRGEIEEAVARGEVTIEEMTEVFRDTITSQCNPPPLHGMAPVSEPTGEIFELKRPCGCSFRDHPDGKCPKNNG